MYNIDKKFRSKQFFANFGQKIVQRDLTKLNRTADHTQIAQYFFSCKVL